MSGIGLPSRSTTRQARFDVIAGMISFGCLVHCLLLPFVLAALPAMSLVVPGSERVHHLLLLLALPATATGLVLGWRHHRRLGSVMTGAIGLALLAVPVILSWHGWWEVVTTVAGSLTIVTAHILNWRSTCSLRPQASR